MFSLEEANSKLSLLGKNWTIINDSGVLKLSKKVYFNDYISGYNKVKPLVDLAEKRNHHPIITIGFKYIEVVLFTHDIGGLVNHDFEMAKEINLILN